MSKSRQEAILVDPLYRKLILGATAIGFNDGTLGITSVTAATPSVVTLATLNAYQIHEHYWPDNMQVSITGGEVPESFHGIFKIKQVSGDPDAIYLYTLKDAPVGLDANTLTQVAAFIVRPIIPKDYFFAQIRVETGAIRYRCDGVIPDANNGIYVGAGGSFQYNGDMDNLKFFAVDNDSPVIHAIITKSHEALGTPTGSTTATVSAGTRVNTTGHNGTGSATVANPQPVELIHGTAVNSVTNPDFVKLTDGTNPYSLSNPQPVIEGYFTQFARGTFRNLGVQATTVAAIAGTAGMKVFGSSTSATAAADKMGHVDMGFIAKRVLIRNNSGKMLVAGWVAGSGTTGGQITDINLSGSAPNGNIIVTCAGAHGIPESGTAPVFLAATEAVLTSHGVKAEGYHIATYYSSTAFTLDLTDVDTFTQLTGTWGYWYKGFTSYCAPATYVPSTATLAGYTLETSSIPGDVYELPYDIAALFILNPASPAGATADTYGTSYVYFMA